VPNKLVQQHFIDFTEIRIPMDRANAVVVHRRPTY
jgi:hypothetical protein